MRLQVVVSSKNQNKNYDLSEAIDGAITWTTQRTGSASKINFDVIKSGQMIFHEGDKLTIFADGKPWIVGYIFAKSKNKEKITITAYDLIRYLQYKQSYNFKNMTASKIIKQVAGEFNIPVGDIVDTGYVLPKKLYKEKTLLDIITDALMLTSIQTKKVYNLLDDAGTLSLKEIKNMGSKYVIGNQSFATDYTYTTSIEDSYNYIKLVKPNKKSGKGDTYIAQDSSTVKKWGKLQYYKEVDENMTPAQIKDYAQNLLKSLGQVNRGLKIPALGIKEIRAGSMVYIDLQDLGDIALKKMLLIDKCTHKITEHHHEMDLEMKVYNG